MPTYSGPLQSVFESSALWLIPLLPLLGAILNAVIGWRIQRANIGNQLAKKLHIGSLPVSAIAVGAMAISFALSIWQVIKLAGLPEHQRTLLCHMWPMVRVGSFDLSFDLSLDPLSAVMLLVVTGIGLLIHIYACGYMEKEPSYWRFFSYLNLFIFSMLLLVLGDNFIIMFFGWEGVGLCSYLLIGFWYQDYGKASAGTKAFLTNRIGDFGFLSGLFILLWALGGNWTSQGYQTDINPRLVPVVLDHASAHDATPVEAAPKPTDHHAHATAYLTFTSFPGAKVYIDGNLSEPLIAPFVRHEIGGPTSYRRTQAVPFGIADDPRAQRAAKAADEPTIPVKILVVPGGATDALDLNKDNNRLDLPVGKETILSPIGTVLSFRDLSNQMLIQDQETGARPFHVGLKSKSLWGIAAITLACIGFFIGAAGKSAQIPLYVWLPDAMAGPTPVSALIHAATMVTAGVYMVARLNFLFSMSATACGVVAVVGACTALYAASIGFFQYDIKKVLAYSTVSQLGFMFIGVGVGAYYAGIFHVVTHAFFKACLFLTAGSVIHGMHAVEHDADRAQDMRVMGGLKRKMPHTRLAYLIACLAITAAPIPLLAGFWSKDEILWRAFSNSNTGIVPGAAIWLVGLLAAACTSFYMWCSYYLTFEGRFNWTPAKHNIHGKPFGLASKNESEKNLGKIHESPPVMTYVLLTLAGLSAIGGVVLGFSTHFFGLHRGDSGYFDPILEHWLHPVTQHAAVSFKPYGLSIELGLMCASVGLAIAAWLLSRKRYGAKRPKDWEIRERSLLGWGLLHNKYYVDEIYNATIVRGVMVTRIVASTFDKYVIDGVVNLSGTATEKFAKLDGLIDHYIVDGAVNAVADTCLEIGSRLRRIETGRIQTYAFSAIGVVAASAIVAFLIRYYGP